MSVLGISRPSTNLSGRGGIPNLPEIPHPLSRLGNPENMDIRGVSRSASDRPVSNGSVTGRPLPQESDFLPQRSRSVPGRGNSRLSSRRSHRDGYYGSLQYEIIPEGVEVRHGDPRKTRLPVFGNRTGLSSRDGMESRVSSRLSKASAQARLEIDELEMMLRERSKGGFYELRKRFKDNDPEQKGNVTREALQRILVTFMNTPINQSQFNRLMERIELRDRQIIGFADFFAIFRDVPSGEIPAWMDPIQRHQREMMRMTTGAVQAQLKEKAKQRYLKLPNIPDAQRTKRARFSKRYDPDGHGSVEIQRFMRILTSNSEAEDEDGKTTPVEKEPESGSSTKRTPRKREIERQRSLNIERWLKKKFREGCVNMKALFEKKDMEGSGEVNFDDFLEVLSQFGLKLEKAHVNEFLARCTVEPSRTGVPYREFLHRFQDRSEQGMAHRILTNPKHRYNGDKAESVSAKSHLSAIETQMMNMFQRDFLTLLGTFHKIDHYGTDLISPEEFRAAIESRFDVELTDVQFNTLLDRLPLNDDGLVKYADFMAQFDTRGKAPSLFETRAGKQIHINALPKDPSPPPSPLRSPPETPEIQADDKDDMYTDEEVPERRSVEELFKIIKKLLKKKYHDVEAAFYEIDDNNSMALTQETTYLLLKRFNIQPEISRGEIRLLWKTLLTNYNKTLNFHEFVRHFGYSLKSASYPNAKVCPPKKGDSDFMMRSRKLNSDPLMLQDNLRSKIDFLLDDLKREFLAMDIYGTGFVSREEFKDILTELVIQLSDYELETLSKKFEIKRDGRVSYVEFLKPYAVKRDVWRGGNDLRSMLNQPQAELPMPGIVGPPQKGLYGITAKLRDKLTGDWKNLRRAFRKLDSNNEGYLSLPEFRTVLRLANVVLDEEEVYQLMAQFDHDLTGKISYHRFLNETFKPASRASVG